MKPKLLLLLLCASVSQVFSQQKELTLTMAYPKNLTHHWAIDALKSNLNINARYSETQGIFLYGAGINYVDYQILWKTYLDKTKSDISILSPYLTTGLHLSKDAISFKPAINFGYSLVPNTIEKYIGDDGGLFLSPSVDLNVHLFKGFEIGLHASYQFSNAKIDLYTEDINLTTDIIRSEDDIIKLFSSGINLIYSF